MEDSSWQAVTEQIYRKYHAPIKRYISRLLGENNPEVVADLASDTFVNILRALKRQPVPEHLRAWVYRIAQNTTFDYLRRRRLIQLADIYDPTIQLSLFDESDEIGELERAMQNVELLSTILQHISEKNKKYALALYLYHIRGLSYADIATALEIGGTKSGVKMYISRALQSCREARIELKLTR
ncbi:MAG TPA: RNA polymerase sigma factor [Candidatus Acidoferrum sp.]|nr:RNA polymerase sigma factor [Candidatus Acidoferrum sp.]